MTVENYGRSGAESLQDQIAVLTADYEAKLADLKRQMEEAQKDEVKEIESYDDTVYGTVPESFKNVENRLRPQSVSRLVVDNILLYRWGKESITKEEVMNIVNDLKEPYNSEVSEYLKRNDIKGVQKYLNSKIDSQEINLDGLRAALKARNISLRGNHILEDGKFGPQTLETIRFFVKEQTEPEPKKPEKQNPEELGRNIEKEPNLDWIIEEMSDAMQDIENGGRGNRSPERNGKSNDMYEVDKNRKRVIIKTYPVTLDGERRSIPDNRCEINWETGKVYTICNGNEYELPVHINAFECKNGYPNGQNGNDRKRVRAFTEIGNLVNFLKASAVFCGKGAVEYQTYWSDFGGGAKGIHLNDGFGGGFTDTKLVKDDTLNGMSSKYSDVGLRFDKHTKVQLASLMTAMKLDLGKIKWNPDIERVGLDPLNEEHKKWVKHYSKTYARVS